MTAKQNILLLTLILLGGLFLVPITRAQISEYPQITNQSCDATNRCPSGLECYGFPNIGLRCAQPDPCTYFKCPKRTECTIALSYPGQVMCGCVGTECPSSSRGDQPVSYDIVTKTEIRTKNQEGKVVSHDISLWEATHGNSGILETTFASVESSDKLIVKESVLFMKTSVGEKPINVMPEDAIAVSKTPNLGSIKKIELKEESQEPVYSVKGTKRARILFIFPVSLEIETKVSAESGNVISVKKPWWSFLTR